MAETLGIARQLFDEINRRNIDYCHWKSNVRLGKAMAGETDLDLLVDRRQARAFVGLLNELGYKEILSPPGVWFPGLSDFLGFDSATAKQVHVHLHYQLVLGEKYTKRYRLPIEQFVFDHCTYEDGVKIPAPEIELILLAIRALLKFDSEDLLKSLIKPRRSPISWETLDELRLLEERSQLNVLQNLIQQSRLEIDPSLITTLLERVRADRIKPIELFLLRARLRRQIARYRWLPRLKAFSKYWIGKVRNIRSIRRRIPLPRKTLTNRGLIIAFIGADGAGKSTVVEESANWLSWRLSVHRAYFGIPKSGIARLLDRAGPRIRSLKRFAQRILPDSFVPERLFAFLLTVADTTKCLWLARYRYRTYVKAYRAAAQGKIVLADRYPLHPWVGMETATDGPGLVPADKSSQPGWLQRCSKLEQQLYRKIPTPDHTFILSIEEATALARKNEAPSKQKTVRQKIEVIGAIPDGTPNTSAIDAGRPFLEVLDEVKHRIWEQL